MKETFREAEREGCDGWLCPEEGQKARKVSSFLEAGKGFFPRIYREGTSYAATSARPPSDL